VHVRLALPLAVIVLVAAGCGRGSAGANDLEEPLLVAAAADLRPAFEEIGAAFEAETGHRVLFSFGSSGQLAQQVIEGAPMDLFASADVALVERVLAAGVGDPESQATYAYGRIVIWSGSTRWGGWSDLGDLAADGAIRNVAIANPEHAPYGRAAREALESVGAWDGIQPKLVYGENVADTQRLAATGNADVAIIALSLARASDESGDGEWTLVDDGLHAPLQQELLVVASDPERAKVAARFADQVNGDGGREVMRRFGFLLPGEASPPEAG
jgi:molybdate transport system substrate-binding protein